MRRALDQQYARLQCDYWSDCELTYHGRMMITSGKNLVLQ